MLGAAAAGIRTVLCHPINYDEWEEIKKSKPHSDAHEIKVKKIRNIDEILDKAIEKPRKYRPGWLITTIPPSKDSDLCCDILQLITLRQ